MSDIPKCDYHIHTKYLRCANETMGIQAIVDKCQELGMTSCAITDHWRGLYEKEQHLLIQKDLEALNPEIDIYFGAEVNDFGNDDWGFTEDLMAECGFQLAIGGIHGACVDEYDLKKIVDFQHHCHINACQNPILDVLVHPYWFWKGEWDEKGWPWPETMKMVPEDYARELGQLAKETGTAIEINGGAVLDGCYGEQFCREYVEDYLAAIADEGAIFMLGSDAHDINGLKSVEASWQAAEKLGLTADRIWHPKGKPFKRGLKPEG